MTLPLTPSDDQLAAWLAGDLDADSDAAISAAVQQDPAVARRADDMVVALLRLTGTVAAPPPPPGLVEGILAATAAEGLGHAAGGAAGPGRAPGSPGPHEPETAPATPRRGLRGRRPTGRPVAAVGQRRRDRVLSGLGVVLLVLITTTVGITAFRDGGPLPVEDDADPEALTQDDAEGTDPSTLALGGDASEDDAGADGGDGDGAEGDDADELSDEVAGVPERTETQGSGDGDASEDAGAVDGGSSGGGVGDGTSGGTGGTGSGGTPTRPSDGGDGPAAGQGPSGSDTPGGGGVSPPPPPPPPAAEPVPSGDGSDDGSGDGTGEEVATDPLPPESGGGDGGGDPEGGDSLDGGSGGEDVEGAPDDAADGPEGGGQGGGPDEPEGDAPQPEQAPEGSAGDTAPTVADSQVPLSDAASLRAHFGNRPEAQQLIGLAGDAARERAQAHAQVVRDSPPFASGTAPATCLAEVTGGSDISVIAAVESATIDGQPALAHLVVSGQDTLDRARAIVTDPASCAVLRSTDVPV